MTDADGEPNRGDPMDCTHTRRFWHLFHDSEGDAELHLQVNEHLRGCPDCARWFDRQTALEESITQALRGGEEPSAEIWGRLERELRPPTVTRARRWMLFGSLGLAVAAALLVVVSVATRMRPADDLALLSASLHERLARGVEGPGFVSDSHSEIERFLKRNVAFPVRCPPREDAGFAARGAGTIRLATDPAAYVVGRVDGADVSLLILARDTLNRFPSERSRLRQSGTHHQRLAGIDVVMTEFDQNLVLAVGRAHPDRLRRMLQAYGSYAHGHPSS